MGTQITKYETKNGKTRRVPSAPEKELKTGLQEGTSGDEQNNTPASPANKGRNA